MELWSNPVLIHSYEWSLHLEAVAISAFTAVGRQVPSRKSSASLHILPDSLSGSFLFLSKAFSETSCVSWILLLTDTLLTSNYHPHRSADRAVHLSTLKHFNWWSKIALTLLKTDLTQLAALADTAMVTGLEEDICLWTSFMTATLPALFSLETRLWHGPTDAQEEGTRTRQKCGDSSVSVYIPPSFQISICGFLFAGGVWWVCVYLSGWFWRKRDRGRYCMQLWFLCSKEKFTSHL